MMIDPVYNTADMRDLLIDAYVRNHKSQTEMVDILGASFIANAPSIFGQINEDYIERELQWYQSMSLNVFDIPGGPPPIWKQVATKQHEPGYVNSNYGFLLLHPLNGSQFRKVITELKRDWQSRRAVAIYTRPSMHEDSVVDGMQDFVCTNAVHYRIDEHSRVHAVVQMRSNDAIFGYRNDYAWQRYALQLVATELGKEAGTIVWQAASFHIYPRHFHLLDTYIATGEWNVPVTKP